MDVNQPEKQAAENTQQTSHDIFEKAGVSIWLQDFSRVKQALDKLRRQGVTDFRAYLSEHPDFVRQAIELVRVVDVNNETLELFGARTKAEMLGSLAQVFWPETETVFREELAALAEGQESVRSEAVLRTLDGRPLSVLFTIHFGRQSSDYSRVVVTITDTTDLKRTDIARARYVEEIQTLLDTLPIGIYFAQDPECRRITGNRTAYKLLNLPPGTNLSQSAPDGERPSHFRVFRNGIELTPDQMPVQRAARGEQIRGEEVMHVFEDGTSINLLVSAAPLHDGRGQTRGAVAGLLDVTERTRAEQARRVGEAQYRALSARLKVLLATTTRLIETLETRELLSSLLNLSREIVAADALGVWRMDAQGDWSIVASSRLSDAFIQESLSRTDNADVPTEPVVVQPEDLADQSTDLLQRRWQRYKREGIRSLMILPLRIHGEITGTLVFYSRSAHRFTEIEIESALALANIAASAITTSELYEAQSSLRQAAEEAAMREAFLADAGAILSRSLDYEETLANVARTAVPQFADWCAVDLLDDGGVLRRLAVAHTDPEKINWAEALLEQYPPEVHAEGGVLQVIRTGKPRLISRIPDSLLVKVAEDDPQRLQILRDLQLASYICVPLEAGGRVYGAITFLAAESQRHFDERDLNVAQEIARRASQAIDNAQLYRNLSEGQRRLRLALTAARAGVWELNIASGKIRWSLEFETLYGYETATPRTYDQWVSSLHPDDREQVVVAFARRIDSDENEFQQEFRIIHPVLGRRWMFDIGYIERDENGRALRCIGINMDITQRKRAEEALAQLNETLEVRVDERTQQVRTLIARLTMAEQEERRRISQILHDDLQQILSAIEMKLSLIRQELRQAGRLELTKGLDEGRAWVEQAITMTRQLTVDLSPPILKNEGLADALEWLQRQMYELHGLEVIVEAEHSFYLPDEDLRVLLFQIVRELLFNVRKHAGVGRAFVRLTEEADQLVIHVSDEGRSFTAEEIVTPRDPVGGFGIYSIRERLNLLGGQLEIQPRPGKGTRVEVRMPLQPGIR